MGGNRSLRVFRAGQAEQKVTITKALPTLACDLAHAPRRLRSQTEVRIPTSSSDFFDGTPYQIATRVERKVDQLYPQIENLGSLRSSLTRPPLCQKTIL